MKELKIPTVPVNIGQRIAFINSVTQGEGVMEFDPNGKSFQEINNLYKFVIKQLASYGQLKVYLILRMISIFNQ